MFRPDDGKALKRISRVLQRELVGHSCLCLVQHVYDEPLRHTHRVPERRIRSNETKNRWRVTLPNEDGRHGDSFGPALLSVGGPDRHRHREASTEAPYVIPLFKGKLERIRADTLNPVFDVHVETLCRGTDLPGQGQEGIFAPRPALVPTEVPFSCSHRPGDDVERPVNLPRDGHGDCLLNATHQRCGARSFLSSRVGPRCQHGAPGARRVRTNGVDTEEEAATRLPVRRAVVERAIDDAPERSGSENRHDDVRVSKSQ